MLRQTLIRELIHLLSFVNRRNSLLPAVILLCLASSGVWRQRAAQAGAPATATGRSLASADFNEDGVPDLLSGYADGAVVLSLGREVSQSSGADVSQAFALGTRAAALPVAADFLGAGDFNADGHADLVAGARGGNKLL
jgi:hypothetical protein